MTETVDIDTSRIVHLSQAQARKPTDRYRKGCMCTQRTPKAKKFEGVRVLRTPPPYQKGVLQVCKNNSRASPGEEIKVYRDKRAP
jgi:hypothetical protein